MTSEEKRGSLADQAAAWVPPWARKTPTDDRVSADPVPAGSTAADSVAADQEVQEPAAVAQEPVLAGQVEQVDPTPPSYATPAGEPEQPAGEPKQSAAGQDQPAGEQEQPAEAADRTEPAATDDRDDTDHEPDDAGHEPDDADREPSRPQAVTDAQNGRLALLDEAELRGALEAILLVVDEPVTEQTLAQVLEQPIERIRTVVQRLAEEYTDAGRGFELRRAAGGWRLYTRPEYAPYVERFVLDGQSVRLTQAALETLAVVAYKQPVTRSRISAIRGVNCDGVIRTLLTRGLVQECGVEPETGAHLYQTTPLFLEKLGINSVDELPPLAPFLPDNVEEIADASR